MNIWNHRSDYSISLPKTLIDPRTPLKNTFHIIKIIFINIFACHIFKPNSVENIKIKLKNINFKIKHCFMLLLYSTINHVNYVFWNMIMFYENKFFRMITVSVACVGILFPYIPLDFIPFFAKRSTRAFPTIYDYKIPVSISIIGEYTQAWK
jgi:magnesium-transporting ATPase (P-type)